MSIFKDTFINEVQEQIKKRQDAIHNRTPQTIQYYNSRNAWIRMTSAVEVDGDGGALAKKNILLGGVLSNDKKLRSGIGTSDQAYSTVTTGGNLHRFGIRPMPGITSIDVKSKSAYGSLREVTINFQCWDINQLEELELLYMRPGYTALVEWGWTPYLNNDGALQTGIDFYGSVLNADKTKEQIWKDLFQKSKDSNGNYDAMFGYIKNYSWSARTDGGYDCTTTILTLGEVLESLKVNYTPFDNPKIIANGVGLATSQGLTTSTLTNMSASYSHNVMAGLFYEMYEIGKAKGEGNADEGKYYSFTSSGSTYDLFHKTININGNDNDKNTNIGESDEQVYISMESLVNLLNNKVILQDSTNNSNFIKLSVKEREYDYTKTPNSSTGDGYLLALAHPLQISVDPTVCLISNPLWTGGGIGVNVNSTEESGDEASIKYSNTSYVNLFNKLIEYGVNIDAKADKIITEVSSITGRQVNEFKELQRQYLLIKEAVVDRGLNTVPSEMAGVKPSFVNYVKDKKFANFYDLLDDSLNTQEITTILTGKEYSNSTLEEVALLTAASNAIKLKPAEADAIEAEAEAAEEELKEILEEAKDGKELTEEQKEVVVEALLEDLKPGESISAEQVQASGVSYADLPPETPIKIRTDENGNALIITAEVAANIELVQDPGALLEAVFTDPGAALAALGSIGADMTESEREEATDMVVATVVATGAAINAAAVATGGSGGGGSSGRGSGSNSPGSRGGRKW
jgi:hypothetical protein